MSLNDLVDSNGLQQDKWSLSKPTFGDEGQLQVIGWSGRYAGKGVKFYILKCSKCSLDSELFGEGVFRDTKAHLVRGTVPCGCSKKTNWSKDQYKTLCSRKAEELGYILLGFTGEWKGSKTKIELLCEKHGEWCSGSINGLLQASQGCPGCRVDTTVRTMTKPNDVMITSFFRSGSFHPNTKFCRSGRLNNIGRKEYWYVFCPVCGETCETTNGNLKKGYRPCTCGKEAKRIACMKANGKPDEVMIKSFLSSGGFHPDTKFWRSDTLDGQGFKRYWFMTCPDCGETGESISIGLQKGHRSCACSKQRQQECYINWIVDGDNKVAIKFGIANNSKRRAKEQNSKAVFHIKQYQIYTFPDVASCKKAERECKKELECGVILKRDMPDGYSETTWVYNLSKIQDIYKRNGGVLV